ncbi:hypothetical protein E2C01_008785 [Portunus trituberculatus]|uniref:Glycolipid transfer protein domain-containing protein n=1 Tax=Portunus trituberculatus TaxID=210409 RepID=A0A5B7D3A2_PORTR|nr:hypothetical protein [Portunus trituberculatus]
MDASRDTLIQERTAEMENELTNEEQESEEEKALVNDVEEDEHELEDDDEEDDDEEDDDEEEEQDDEEEEEEEEENELVLDLKLVGDCFTPVKAIQPGVSTMLVDVQINLTAVVQKKMARENGQHYVNLKSMIKYEMENSLLVQKSTSGTKAILLLHRGMEFTCQFLREMIKEEEEPKLGVATMKRFHWCCEERERGITTCSCLPRHSPGWVWLQAEAGEEMKSMSLYRVEASGVGRGTGHPCQGTILHTGTNLCLVESEDALWVQTTTLRRADTCCEVWRATDVMWVSRKGDLPCPPSLCCLQLVVNVGYSALAVLAAVGEGDCAVIGVSFDWRELANSVVMGTVVMVWAVSPGNTGRGRVGLCTCISSENNLARRVALSSLLVAVDPFCLVRGEHAVLPHQPLPLLYRCHRVFSPTP